MPLLEDGELRPMVPALSSLPSAFYYSYGTPLVLRGNEYPEWSRRSLRALAYNLAGHPCCCLRSTFLLNLVARWLFNRGRDTSQKATGG